MRRRVPLVTALLGLLPNGAAADSGTPTVRVWAATRIEMAAEAANDEAGARWVEVHGRLASDRGEGIPGADLVFERGEARERTTTGDDGAFALRLRADGTSWTARFVGGERWRPSSSPVPSPEAPPRSWSWLVFVPLFALAGALVSAAAVLVLRRAPHWFSRLRSVLRLPVANRRDRRNAGSGDTLLGGGPRQVRVMDALRHRPVAGARLETCEGRPVATAGADGVLVIPEEFAAVTVVSSGYLPRDVPSVPPEPPDGEPAEPVVPLLRGRDAVVGMLEGARGQGLPARPLETVLEMAGRLVAHATAERLARICYGFPHRLGPPELEALAALGERLRGAAKADPANEVIDPVRVAAAVSSEVAATIPESHEA